MKKLVFSLMIIIGFTLSSQAQSAKVKAKINRKIEKINTSIVKGDASAALTLTQRKQIFEILYEAEKKIKAIKKAHKGEANLKELIKTVSKKANKKISKTVLTKQQRQAKKIAKSNNPPKY